MSAARVCKGQCSLCTLIWPVYKCQRIAIFLRTAVAGYANHRSTIRHTAIIRSLYNTLIYALQKILDLI